MSFNYGSTSIKINIFQEAMDHCRWKRQLDTVLLRPELHDNILQDYSGKSFEEILLTVYNICEKVKGVGMLTVYDIVAAICRFNNINIEMNVSQFLLPSNGYKKNQEFDIFE